MKIKKTLFALILILVVSEIHPENPVISEKEFSIEEGNRRAGEIRFTPYEMLNPENGKPIGGSKILILPNGKKISAAEYYTQLNETEKWFNEKGYSLRIKKNDTSDEDTGLKMLLNVDYEELKRKNAEILENYMKYKTRGKDKGRGKPLEKISLPNGFEFDNNNGSGDNSFITHLDPNQMYEIVDNKRHRPGDPKSFLSKYNWGEQYGMNQNFQALYYSGLHITHGRGKNSNRQNANVYIYSKSDGYIFNNQFSLSNIKLRANYNSDKKTVDGKVTAWLFGAQIYEVPIAKSNVDFNNPYASGKNPSFTKEISFSQRFAVGPIPLKATVGVSGTFSFDWNVKINPASSQCELVPKLNFSCFGSVDVDVVIAGAGLQTKLVFLDYQEKIESLLKTVGNDQVFEEVKASESVHLLDGSVVIRAWIYVPRFGNPPWKKKTFTLQLFSWEGINLSEKELCHESKNKDAYYK